jgi:hypothetical protein
MDNTSKQNKSKYVFSYLAYLLHRGDCTTITVSFLPVGHTHEDIDQFFSRLSVYLRGHDALCRGMLAEGISEAYRTKQECRASVYHLDRATNFSDWIHPYINTRTFIGLTLYHQFKSELVDT